MKSLQPIAEYKVNIPEPSDLALTADGQFLWTVSDPDGCAYKLTTGGKIVQKLPCAGRDLEGIALTGDERFVWLVDETRREIVQMDTTGKQIAVFATGISGKKNSGLEGIAWHPEKQVFYVLNEKKPGKIIRLSKAMKPDREFPLDAADDFSGMCYDPRLQKFWLVSDQSRLLMLWSEANGVETSYALHFDKAEGVAVDVRQKRLYIISDSEEKLYEYNLPE